MSNSSQRDRAEAALGHLQRAAGEMIAAARDALDLVEDAVSTAGVEDMLDVVDHLSRSVFTWARTQDHWPPTASSRAHPDPDSGDSATDSGDSATDSGDRATDRGSQQATRPRNSGANPGPDRASNQESKPGRTRRPPPGDGPVERIPVR